MGPGELSAIVLAAGSGSRFGGGKLVAPWRGGRLIGGALAAAFAAPVREVVVVTGADPVVRRAAEEWAKAHGQTSRLRLIHAADHSEGMGASLRAGVSALGSGCGGVFVFLGDMPSVPHGVSHALASALTAGMLAAAPQFHGRRGHPVLFGAPLLPLLSAAKGDQGAREALQDLDERLALIDWPDSGVVFDVDRPADLER